MWRCIFLKKHAALSALLVCAIAYTPLQAFANDGDYTVQYFESETDFFNQNGASGSGNFGTGTAFSGQPNGYITTTVDEPQGYMPGGAMGYDVVAVTQQPKAELWSREPLGQPFRANQYQWSKKAKPVTIVINGKKYTPRDTPAIVIDGRVFVPLRFVAEQLGYSVSWNEETMTAEINDGAVKVEVGSYTMWKYDAMTVPTDTPPFFYQGTLMVGLRQIGHALNFQVKWDAVNKTAYLERAIPKKQLQQHNVFNTSK